MSKRIVLATWGSLGDLHPYMALARELRRRGDEPVIASIPLYREKVEDAGIAFHPVRPDFPASEEAADLVRRAIDRRDGARFIFRELLGPHLGETYEDTLAAVTSGSGADLVVSHVIAVTVPLIAEKTGIPWVSTVLSPISFFSAYDPPTPPFLSWTRALVGLHPALARAFTGLGKRATRAWVRPVRDLRRELDLPEGKHPLFEGQHSPTRVLALFSPVFAPAQPDFPPRTVVTGFPFYDGAEAHPMDPALGGFLDSGPPPVLFTLGSSAIWDAGEFYETGGEVAERLGRRVLLLVGNPENIPRRLPDGVAAFEYAPFSRVMPRCSAVVHQGGIGTTAQALRAGRPQLVMPFGHDTLDNARRVTALGVGQTASRSRFSARAVARALGELLTAGYEERSEEVGRQIRAEDGVGTACDLIGQAV